MTTRARPPFADDLDFDDAPLRDDVSAMAGAFATCAVAGWQLSPSSTVRALALALEAIAVKYLTEHPARRAAVLQLLHAVAANVAAETGPRH